MKKKKVPKSTLQNLGLTTQREYKALKRKQLRATIKAYEKYRSGCAYCPGYCPGYRGGYGDLRVLQNALNRLQESHSVKEWGR